MSSFPLECVRKEKARWVRANQTSKAPGRCEVRAHWTLRTENRSCWNIYSHNSPGTPFTPWVDEHRSKTLFILLQKTFSPSLPSMLCDQMLSSFVNYLFNFLKLLYRFSLPSHSSKTFQPPPLLFFKFMASFASIVVTYMYAHTYVFRNRYYLCMLLCLYDVICMFVFSVLTIWYWITNRHAFLWERQFLLLSAFRWSLTTWSKKDLTKTTSID